MAVRRAGSIGDNCLDSYVGAPEIDAVGGSALNVAVNLARAGWESIYIGAVADDPAGEAIRRGLEAAGVAARLHTLPGNTAVTRLRLLPDGDREFLHEDFGVGLDLVPSDDDLDALTGCAVVHCTGLADPMPVVHRLKARGQSVSYDLTTHPWPDTLAGIDIAFISGKPATASEVAHRAVEAGAGIAVVTLGPEGSLANDGTGEVRVAACPTEVLDTCGAGDAYIAAFLVEWAEGAGLEAAMGAGTAAGAAACRHYAAWPQPGAREVTA